MVVKRLMNYFDVRGSRFGIFNTIMMTGYKT